MSDSSQLKESRYDEKLSVRLAKLAKGQWAEILESAGIHLSSNPSKKTECPIHAGEDKKFRFENAEGNGLWHCSVCGHGSGLDLLRKVKGLNFVEAALWVIYDHFGEAGNKTPLPSAPQSAVIPKERPADELARIRSSYQKVWNEAKPVTVGDPVWLYLRSRIPGLVSIPVGLRLHPGLSYFGFPPNGGGYGKNYGQFACMVAAVVDETGKCCNIHRTYLTMQGKKLALQEPDEDDPTALIDLPSKKLMKSVGARHYQIRLAKPINGVLGIAEGIETSLAAMIYSGVPTWPTVSDSGMANFMVPEAIQELVIFADNDHKTVRGGNPGLDAARKLVERPDVEKRIFERTLKVVIRTPATQGTDMVDFLQGIVQDH